MQKVNLTALTAAYKKGPQTSGEDSKSAEEQRFRERLPDATLASESRKSQACDWVTSLPWNGFISLRELAFSQYRQKAAHLNSIQSLEVRRKYRLTDIQ